MHNGDIEEYAHEENTIEGTKETLGIKIEHLQKIRELTDEGKLTDVVQDVHETEKDILQTIAVLIVLKKRYAEKTFRLLPTSLVRYPTLREWCVSLGISEEGGEKIVQKFHSDFLGFLELSDWGRSHHGGQLKPELSEESFTKQLTLIKGTTKEDVRRLWHANHHLSWLIDKLEQSDEPDIFFTVNKLVNGIDGAPELSNHYWSSWKNISHGMSPNRKHSTDGSEPSPTSPFLNASTTSSVFTPPRISDSGYNETSSPTTAISNGNISTKKHTLFHYPKNKEKKGRKSHGSPSRNASNGIQDPLYTGSETFAIKDGLVPPDFQSTPYTKSSKSRPKLTYADVTNLSLDESMEKPGLPSYDTFQQYNDSFDEAGDSFNRSMPISRDRSKEAFRSKCKTAFKSMLVDWEVPFEDLNLERELPGGRFGTKCHIGKWHGECVIRVIKVDPRIENPEVVSFKQELHHYKRTRHDNVELFLGACLCRPNLAILTRYYRGPRLDEKIRDEALNLINARLLAEHIINGLKYLHAKDILHKDLRPANIMYDLAGKAVIKGLGLTTVSALTGVGSIRQDSGTKDYYIDVPNDWIHRLSPELATIDFGNKFESKYTSSIIPKLKYSKQSDIYAFGVLWAELMQAVHRSSQTAPRNLKFDDKLRRKEKEKEIRIILNNPPTDNFESKLFNAGLGKKIEVPDPIQDQARCLISRCLERSPENRPDCEWIADRLGKVQPDARLTRRWTCRDQRS